MALEARPRLLGGDDLEELLLAGRLPHGGDQRLIFRLRIGTHGNRRTSTSDPAASTNLPDHGSKPVSKRNTPVKSPKPKGSTPERPIFDWLRPLPPMN